MNAGNPFGVWLRIEPGKTEMIALKGTPLGLFLQLRVQERILVLEPGDRVLFGTDGLFDAYSPDRVFFRERIPQLWHQAAGIPLERALASLFDAAKQHAGGKFLDDLLVVGLEQPRWSPEPHQLLQILPSEVAAVVLADQGLERVLADFGPGLDLTHSRRFDLILALHEALTNAIEHGNRGDPGKRVALDFSLTEAMARVRVVDEGPGFDLAGYQPPEGHDSERGRGIAILRAITTRLRMCAGELEFDLDLKGAADDVHS
jgi:anti-sigma regulatory factor (Ser/Thr protein kinase)